MTAGSLPSGASANRGASVPKTTDVTPAPPGGPVGALPSPPLGGLRVVDLSTWIGGAYCTKLLADAGAEVTKVEAPAGDPLRRWSASGAAIPAGGDGALFNFLAASKQSVVVDEENADDLVSLEQLLASA